MKRSPLCFGLSLVAVAALALAPAVHGAASLVVVNMDGAGEGFNDPTPAAPIGGNPGITRGQQRLNAFQFAADIWGAVLDSAVPIKVQAFFNPLTCTPTGATLGAAGAIQIFANFPGRELDNTWYHVALANKLSGVDLAPGPDGTNADDIVAFFNSNLNGNPACLGGRGFYLGLDANHGTDIDLVTVLLHEFGHGLGFANFVTEASGSRPLGLGDIYSQYTYDVTKDEIWNTMTTAELVASAVNSRRVVWNGINVTAGIPAALAFGTPLLTVNSPASVAGAYAVGTAQFGPLLAAPGVTGNLVIGLDPANGAGPSTTDGCSPLTNGAAVAGNIAVMDRGTCGFVIKVKNAQNAGATAVIIADNAAGAPPAGMSGADATITIPSVRITLPDGTAIKAAIGVGTVNGTLGVDLSVRAGTEASTGLVHLNAPNPVVPGSSISHWDPIAFPNQLMEPAINADLTHNVSGVDLTLAEMTDIGWFSDGDGVPDGSDSCLGTTPTVIIDGCDSGALNDVGTDGCGISDQIDAIAASASNHGKFVSGVAQLLNALKKAGIITDAEKDAIQSCAGSADIP